MTKSQARLTVVTNMNYERAKRSPQLHVCYKCGAPFKVGMIIVTKKSTRSRWYHKSCAEKLNIGSDD
jgi:hypothetical protein